MATVVPVDAFASNTAPRAGNQSSRSINVPVPELSLALVFAVIGITISQIFGLAFGLPTSGSLAFTGVSYLVPLLIVVGTLLVAVLLRQVSRAAYFLAVIAAYGTVLIVHFNIKLWVWSINPMRWDAEYGRIDQMFQPLVDGARSFHNALPFAASAVDRLYLFAFLAMFACSIIVHSMRAFIVLREVVLASMIVHVLGGLSYLIAPALGPFITDAGVNALETKRQIFMLSAHHAALAGGPDWFVANGSEFLATGLAAMPSLHVASSAVFVYFAWAYERRLCWVYFPLFGFIMIEAVATRWHYLVDIVAGLGLTAVAIILVERVLRPWLASDARFIFPQRKLAKVKPLAD